ncbi:hypothetical protein [Saccharomonospora glauca]|uniref:Uncharacterized protein n=1 Tax=Saccharomonospora glauca K62 TaxID=928724 RepID=I1D2X9_9PSEU|nr:hypothetical protein [Saccharomonospora glauca]EIE99303.1 hypothetical protein SacglDRAFT_02410 [Saccharomonospora glauca K62]
MAAVTSDTVSTEPPTPGEPNGKVSYLTVEREVTKDGDAPVVSP